MKIETTVGTTAPAAASGAHRVDRWWRGPGRSSGRRADALDWSWRVSLALVALFQLAHADQLPLLLTYDGHWYVRLADVLGSAGFDQDWDFLRTPLYPLLLKLVFGAFGRQALGVILLQAALTFAGIVLLGRTLRRAGFRREAPVVVLLLALCPNLVAYEHAVLTEAGSFFFLAWITALASSDGRKGRVAPLLVAALTLGFYYRSSLVYAAPLAALVFWIREPTNRRRQLAAVAVALLPFALAYPWQRDPRVRARTGESVLFYGVVRQGVIPATDPLAGELPGYREALAAAESRVVAVPLGGLVGDGSEYGAAAALAARDNSLRAFGALALEHPRRYGAALARNVALLSGFGDEHSDSAALRSMVLTASGTIVLPGPSSFPDVAAPLARAVEPSLTSRLLRWIAPVYDVLLPLAVLATLVIAWLGIRRRDPFMLACSLLPLAYLGLHAALLMSQDRMGIPAQPIVLLNLIALPACLARAGVRVRSEQQDAWLARADRHASAVLLGLGCVMVTLHVGYLLRSTMIPSADEAHAMSGVLRIVQGLRAGTWSEAWAGDTSALGFKAPLLCVPAAALHFVIGGYVLPSMLSLALVWTGILAAAYSLFRNALRPAGAATAAALLATSPMVTGLTHRFYAEGLLLLLILLWLDRLVRGGLRRPADTLLAGVVAGLGVLCQSSFALIATPALCWVVLARLGEEARSVGLVRALLRAFARLCGLALVAFALSWTWYSHNWRATLDHAQIASSHGAYGYPTLAATLSFVSVGPHFFVFLLAAAGLVPLLRALAAGLPSRQRDAWVVLLLTAAVTILVCTTAVNKTARFSATWLPAVSVVAVFFIVSHLGGVWRLAALLGAGSLSFLLCLHNSFAILPVKPVRLGSLRLLDQAFPLNPPGWFDDNHPLDRRPNPLPQVADRIAADVEAQYGAGHRARVRLTVHGLLANHDYMNLLSAIRSQPADYQRWEGATTEGPEAPDYIIGWSGFARLHSGSESREYYPALEREAELGAIAYERIGSWPAAAGTEVLLFRRRKLRSMVAEAPVPGQVLLKAEQRTRGSVALERRPDGVRVIVSEAPAAFVRFDVDLPRAGLYQLEFRCAAPQALPLRLQLNGEGRGFVDCGSTDRSGEALEWRPVGVYPLNAGRNALRLVREGRFPAIAALLLTPLDDGRTGKLP